MATANDVVQTALSHVGEDESRFNGWAGWAWGTAWCANFLSEVMINECGMDVQASASAAGFASQFDRIPDEEAGEGDVVFFNWDGVQEVAWSEHSHVALVEWFDHDSDYFGTVDGNSTGNRVAKNTYNNNANYFTAFFRPRYDGADYSGADCGTATPSASADSSSRYRAYTKEDGWLDWMQGTYDTGGSGDDYAGVEGHWIYGFEAGFFFKVVLMDGSETDWVMQWQGMDQAMRGIKVEDAKYQAHFCGVGWGKVENGMTDDGAGDDEHAIDMVRVW